MRRSALLLLAALVAALIAGDVAARLPARVDAFAQSPATKELASIASTPGFVAPGTKIQLEPRLGVPTFLWAAKRPVPAGVRSHEETARSYLAEFAPLYRLDAADAAAASLGKLHDTGRGVVIVEFREEVEGVEVFRETLKVAMRRDGSLLSLSGYLSGAPARAGRQIAASYAVDPRRAIAAAFKDMTDVDLAPSAIRPAGPPRGAYSWFDLAKGRARIKKVLFHLPEKFVPAYYVELDLEDAEGPDGAMNSFVVSARDSGILFRNDLTASDAYSYRVWAEPSSPFRPFDGPQGNAPSPHPTGLPNGYQPPFIAPELVTLQNGPISTNDPWLESGATETVGNNADAYADLLGPDGFGPGDLRATTTSPGVFDRTYNPSQAPNASTDQIMAAATQLFFDVNFLHDWFYDAGFTEAAGNAQANNYGRGGIDQDALRAEAQDYGGTNNANMSTPADGARPRMQMYVWTPRTTHTVTVTPPGAVYENGTAAFGPQGFDVTGGVVLSTDGVGTTTDGCETIGSGVSGKIALIDRGTCTYERKVVNAQTAGAIGAIITNVAAGTPPGMTDDPAVPGPVTIPVLSVSQTDGNAIKAALLSGPVAARLFRELAPNRDGTIDNTIVAHEWGHYISNRLIGDGNGLGNTQGGGMGEGWADFHALLLIARPEDTAVASNTAFDGAYPVASYSVGGNAALGGGNEAYYFGLRRYPYATDMAKNPLTFRHITTGVALPVGPPVQGGGNNAEVHRTGEVWATMVWECYASLLRDTLGATPRLTFVEAQRRMRDYLVAGYKLTPAVPTFVEARDALLTAIAAGDLVDLVACEQAFARRGLGLRAIAPDRYSLDNSGLVESFTAGNDLEFVSATLGDAAGSCDADGVLDSSETALLTMTLRNVGTGALAATSATVGSTDPAISFPSGQVAAFPPSQPFGTTSASIPVHLGIVAGIVQTDINIAFRDPGFAIPGDRLAAASFRANTDELHGVSTTDDVEAEATPFTPAGAPAFEPTSGWRRLAADALDHRWLGPDAASGPTDQFLISPTLQVSTTGSFGITFRHRYEFENDATPTYYDGGVIEISTDGGSSFTDIGALASPGYNGTLSTCCSNPLGGQPAYVKTNASTPSFDVVTVNLGSAYSGLAVKLRFRVVTDQAVGASGWEIDDLAVTGIDNTPFSVLVPDAGSCLHPGAVALHVDKNGVDPSRVDFSWGASCGNDVSGYAVYDGSLGSYYDETPIACDVTGTSLAGQATGLGSRYFLVVPVSASHAEEGSHGIGVGGPRPGSPFACYPTLDPATCE